MVKQRIIKYLEIQGISKYNFYKKTGFSNGFLDKSGSIGVDKCEIILLSYPNINIEWLVLGKGDMTRSEAYPVAMEPDNVYTLQKNDCEKEIDLLKKEIENKNKIIALLEKNIQLLEESRSTYKKDTQPISGVKLDK